MMRTGLIALFVSGCSIIPEGPPKLGAVGGVGPAQTGDLAVSLSGRAFLSTSRGTFQAAPDGDFSQRDDHTEVYARLFADSHNNLYQAGQVSLAGSSTWAPVALPSGGTFSHAAESSDGTIYVAELVDNYCQLYRQSGTSWIPVGDRIAQFEAIFADKQGALWIETRLEELFVVRGSTVAFAHRSRGLIGVGPDGTAYYKFDTGLLEGPYGGILAVDEAGNERAVTRGDCEDNGDLECPQLVNGNYLYNLQVAPDGAIWESVGAPPYPPWYGHREIVMRLPLGSDKWRPVIDAQPTYVIDDFILDIGPDSTVWVAGNSISTATGGGGTSQTIYGAAFRGHP